MKHLTIRGYTNRPSVAPGEMVTFHVSVDQAGPFQARLVRLISGDLNPAGPGPQERPVETALDGVYDGASHRTQTGSFVLVDDSSNRLAGQDGIDVRAYVWATTPARGEQTIISRWDSSRSAGWKLFLRDGRLTFEIGDGRGGVASVQSDKALFPEVWYHVTAVFSPADDALTITQSTEINGVNSRFGPVVPLEGVSRVVARAAKLRPRVASVAVVIGGTAENAEDENGRTWVVDCFNGKIDSPACCRVDGTDRDATLLARWDFARGIGPQGISADLVADIGPHGLHGTCVNQPDRASTGWNWTGEEERFTHAPDQYGAIWFHRDNIDDCRWPSTLEWEVPQGFKSGCYALRVEKDSNVDFIPFFVRPSRDAKSHGPVKSDSDPRIAVLIPTFSYLAYANTQVGQNSQTSQVECGHVTVLEHIDLEINERGQGSAARSGDSCGHAA